jgi:hypothetical protein
VTGHDLPVRAILRLIFGIEGHVNRREGHELASRNVAFAVSRLRPGVNEDMREVARL